MLASKQCTYTISKGLIEVLMAFAKMEKQEVWSTLADLTQVCFDRLDKKPNQTESWRWVDFPGTKLRMKIKVGKHTRRYNRDAGRYEDGPPTYSCSITFKPNDTETFTSRQVEEFLVEKVLLGIDD